MVSGVFTTAGATERMGVAAGAGGSFTVTRTLSAAFPPGPIAVATYVTDDDGETWRLPLTGTFPTPGWIVTLVAF